jgi:hypothetical protein
VTARGGRRAGGSGPPAGAARWGPASASPSTNHNDDPAGRDAGKQTEREKEEGGGEAELQRQEGGGGKATDERDGERRSDKQGRSGGQGCCTGQVRKLPQRQLW